ncbi:PTS sorbitol transporter subunit IIA [Dolosicoccus paucivorans]|uniref:PTS glucitol/sorbitol transporter subunit IIA n=1 Tax=Dolosicoccus paucivorans TaxID=84521 RepID=UPI000C80110F|nr:PTS glucitol/sorbitol transporter subunit IIA [Dolosicoccus paucivorans]PMB85082.1 PTS sorbitol transporter subunit IIA [Dolosicoccus paucivorans]
MSIYKTSVTNIGADAEMFVAEEMIILFGENAPDDLKDYVYNIVVTPLNGEISPGQSLLIDGEAFEITAVGNVVGQNLEQLGHITLKFDGSKQAELPGTLYLESKSVPVLQENSTLEIIA